MCSCAMRYTAQPGLVVSASYIQLSSARAVTLRRRLACTALRSSMKSTISHVSSRRGIISERANPSCHRARDSDSYTFPKSAPRDLRRCRVSLCFLPPKKRIQAGTRTIVDIRSLSSSFPPPLPPFCSSSMGNDTWGIWNCGSPLWSLMMMSELSS